MTAVYLYWRKTRWVRVGRVTQLYLFPLKGGQALSVPELECGDRGPRRGDILDRGFMIGTDDVSITLSCTSVMGCFRERLLTIEESTTKSSSSACHLYRMVIGNWKVENT